MFANIVIYTYDKIPYIFPDKKFIFPWNSRLKNLRNELLNRNPSQACLKDCTSAQKLHFITSSYASDLQMTASALKHDQDIIIIKSTKGVKLFWYEEVAEVRSAKKCAIILFMEKAANALTLCHSKVWRLFPTFHFENLIASKFRQWV